MEITGGGFLPPAFLLGGMPNPGFPGAHGEDKGGLELGWEACGEKTIPLVAYTSNFTNIKPPFIKLVIKNFVLFALTNLSQILEIDGLNLFSLNEGRWLCPQRDR